MNGQFLFVQESGNAPQRRSTKSQIKMHVMDRLVSQRQQARTRSRPGASIAPRGRGIEENQLVESRERTLIAPGEAWTVQPENQSPKGIESMLHASGLVRMSSETKLLLHHFLHHRSKSLCTVTVETGWLTYALRDVALFYSTLYHWAFLNYESLPPSFRRQNQLLQVRGTAIKTINDKLNVEGGVVTDELIASVTCLASVNLMMGDFEEAKTHFRGLNAMVASRKGVRNLGFRGLIARLVKWADACHAQVSSSHLSVEDPAAHVEEQPTLDWGYFTLNASPILHRMRNISKELTQTPRDRLPRERRVSLGEQFLASDRELLGFIHGDTTPLLISIVASAALLYSQTVLRGIPRSSRVLKSLVRHLKNAITTALEVAEGDIFAPDPVVAPWALLIGVLASEKGSFESHWFMFSLRSCAQGGVDWREVEKRHGP
ncbi:hypothetical protein BJ875DRAFT_484086 [Amylocarpus encephaloides]|uniref:Uncharacterized protein n=1 Tax=Amylocarpus encephaloides TaxID=45428 RepID=A0A9P7YJD4_9HELO|nr:hypothetical protein BJ875DRAFT_484086 [Amylocarpus encephaloides]